ncbi:hypothetical protein LTR84_005758 [Exophiala bonariae]|uniref:Alcohol dehydrogenase iron-type/glycerol dehydrogenase GldA domain-containing protein n=1 Tax=Exophiala bonariae TaxID=1690606 RepID=A0AAV9N650_9EURO|nr:hypothetical protein LTR84_005758 [Exophiala bonariae]
MSQLITQEFVEGESGPLISYGIPAAQACHYHIEATLNGNKIYLLCSKSLATNTNVVDQFQRALGDRIVGLRIGMKPHTLWSEVVDIINNARPLNVDVIITIGAGSLTDAAKVIAWGLANDVRTEEDLGLLAHTNSERSIELKPPSVRHIAVPTTLSGGEYTSFAGATDDKTKIKTLFRPPTQNPTVVVLDPEIAATTPSRLFLGTGIRAVDHCVETICSLESNENADIAAMEGLKLLIPSLLAYKREPRDDTAIMRALLGAAESIKTSHYGVPKGASHAIGHQLGPLGVPHGETSCIMLPAVCRFNALKGANVEQQDQLAEALLRIVEVSELMKDRTSDLAAILDSFIAVLGLPRTLSEVGIGKVVFETLAENTLTDMWAKTNPVPLMEKQDVLEILELAL